MVLVLVMGRILRFAGDEDGHVNCMVHKQWRMEGGNLWGAWQLGR